MLRRLLSTGFLAQASSRRPWTTIGIWVAVFLIAAFLRASLFDGVITTEFAITNNPESSVGKQLMEEKLTGTKGPHAAVIARVLLAKLKKQPVQREYPL